jgi:hypothetical protein
VAACPFLPVGEGRGRALPYIYRDLFHRTVVSIMFSVRCRNCGILASTSPCHVCLTKRKCRGCSRYLDDHLFNDSSIHCYACSLKSTKPKRRTALNETIMEYDLNIGDGDVDLTSFLNGRAQELRDLVQTALSQHT